jgi:hypothetical protein
MDATLNILKNYDKNAFKDMTDPNSNQKKLDNFYDYQKQFLGYNEILPNNKYISLKENSIDVIYGKDNKKVLKLDFGVLSELNEYKSSNNRPFLKLLNGKEVISNKKTYNFLNQFWKNPEAGSCSSFAVASAQFLFKLKYNSNDAGCLKQNNYPIWCFSKRSCRSTVDLKSKSLSEDDLDKLIPGSILGIYNPHSQSKQCNNQKVLYTHVALYIGKFNDKYYIMENWGGRLRVMDLVQSHMNVKRSVKEVILPESYVNFLDDYYSYLQSHESFVYGPDDIAKSKEEVPIKNGLIKQNTDIDSKGIIRKAGNFFRDLWNKVF